MESECEESLAAQSHRRAVHQFASIVSCWPRAVSCHRHTCLQIHQASIGGARPVADIRSSCFGTSRLWIAADPRHIQILAEPRPGDASLDAHCATRSVGKCRGISELEVENAALKVINQILRRDGPPRTASRPLSQHRFIALAPPTRLAISAIVVLDGLRCADARSRERRSPAAAWAAETTRACGSQAN